MIRITGNWLRNSSDRDTTAKRLYPITEMLDKNGLKLVRVSCKSPVVDIGNTRFMEQDLHYQEPLNYKLIDRQVDKRPLNKQLYEALTKGFCDDPLRRLIWGLTYLAPREVTTHEFVIDNITSYEPGSMSVTYEDEQKRREVEFYIEVPKLVSRLSFGHLCPDSYVQDKLREAGRTDRLIVTARVFDEENLEAKIAKLK